MPFFGTWHFRKSAPIPKENACEPDLSVVSFLSGLALMKTTVLESMRTLSYFRLDTLYYLTDTMLTSSLVPTPLSEKWCGHETKLTSSLEVLHTLWCTLVCRNSVKLNFVKTGLKFEFGVNPQSFSHELCLITRFGSTIAFLGDNSVVAVRPDPVLCTSRSTSANLEWYANR